jgi:Flp pilus assembly protein TadG
MKTHSRKSRKGSVTVEFAFVAPLFLAIVLGVTETSRMYEAQNLLSVAAREGARVAAMDRDDFLGEGESTNEKIIADVKSFLESAGVNPDAVEVVIATADDPNVDFDLDDPANDLELFQVIVKAPLAALSSDTYIPDEYEFKLEASITFRNARAPALVQ